MNLSKSLTLPELLDKLKQADRGSWSLNNDVYSYFFHQKIMLPKYHVAFTTDLNILTEHIIKEVLPHDVKFSVGITNSHDYSGPSSHVWFPTRLKIYSARAKTLPLALLIAILEARLGLKLDKKETR